LILEVLRIRHCYPKYRGDTIPQLFGIPPWNRTVLAYRSDFANRGITSASVAIDDQGYISDTNQEMLLFRDYHGGESQVSAAVFNELMTNTDRVMAMQFGRTA
jgi:hypothetical protein